MSDFYSAANASTNGREVFRSQQAAGERKAAAVKHIAPIGEAANGRRSLENECSIEVLSHSDCILHFQ